MKNLILGILLLVLASCAGWRAGEVEKVGSFPKELNESMTEKVKLDLKFVRYDHYYNGELKESALTDTKKQELMEAIREIYEETGLFIFTTENPDLTVNLSIKSEGTGSLNRVLLTYASLFLIPSSSETRFTVSAEFKKNNGQLLGEIEKSDVVEKWQQLFLIFAMPFKYPYVALKETLTDLNRAVIMEAFKEDYFREALD